MAGLSQTGRFHSAARRRTSALPRPHSAKGAPDVMLARGLKPRAVVAQVVEVGAVGDDRRAQFVQPPLELVVQLGLAVVAAVGPLADVVGIGQLVGFDHDVPDADQLGQLPGGCKFPLGQAGAVSRHRDGPLAQGQLGRFGHHGAVDAAGKRHDAAFQPGESTPPSRSRWRRGRGTVGHDASRPPPRRCTARAGF